MVPRFHETRGKEADKEKGVIYLDTHILDDLGQGNLRSLSKEARRLMNREAEFHISPMVLLELEYLREIGRLRIGARDVLTKFGSALRLRVCDLPFQEVALQAANESWTRDPFDRIIVAQARLSKMPLITRDSNILAHYNRAIS